MWDPKEQVGLRDIGFGGTHRARQFLSAMPERPVISDDLNAFVASAFALASISASLFRMANALERAFPQPPDIED